MSRPTPIITRSVARKANVGCTQRLCTELLYPANRPSAVVGHSDVSPYGAKSPSPTTARCQGAAAYTVGAKNVRLLS